MKSVLHIKRSCLLRRLGLNCSIHHFTVFMNVLKLSTYTMNGWTKNRVIAVTH